VNECLLFRGPYSRLNECPKCQESRWLPSAPAAQLRKRHDKTPVAAFSLSSRPRKVFRYFPIAPRLAKLFAHPVYSHLFTYGDKHTVHEDGLDSMEDIHHTPAWTGFQKRLPFAEECVGEGEEGLCERRVAFMLSADAASLSKWQSQEMSITPYILTILNWPIWERCKEEFLLFVGISPKNCKNERLYLGNYTAID